MITFPAQLLLPSLGDLAGWAGVVFAVLVFIGLGRALSGGRAQPEIALFAGWGGACIVLTLWGVITPASLRIPAAALALVGAFGLAAPGSRLSKSEGVAIWRIAVIALPFFAVMASAQPSQPDTFLNLLPNAAYLFDHAGFPAAGRAPAHSFIAGAPYNMQLASLMAALPLRHFPASAMIGLNIVWQVAAGLFLARLCGGMEDDPDRVPSWGSAALGFLLATGLNPGFQPRWDVSPYSEPSVTVTVAIAAWLAAWVCERIARRGSGAAEGWLLALVLAALINIKQESVALAFAILCSALASASFMPSPERRRAWRVLAAAATAAIVLYAAWRGYVFIHDLGELKLAHVALWQPSAITKILHGIIATISRKGFFFGMLGIAMVGAVLRLRRSGFDLAARTGAILIGTFVLYSGALIFAYVTVFVGKWGQYAHSYFRYCTHLSLLGITVLVVLLRSSSYFQTSRWRFWPRRSISAALVSLALISPIIFLSFLRFDLQVPQLRLRALAKGAAQSLDGTTRLALVLPHDNGSVATALETALRTLPPRRPALTMRVFAADSRDMVRAIHAAGYSHVLISCGVPDIVPIPRGSAALLRFDKAGGLRPVWVRRYAPPAAAAHWDNVLDTSALCLSRLPKSRSGRFSLKSLIGRVRSAQPLAPR